MAVYVCDQKQADMLIAERRLSGCDRFDEVWDGVYVMSPVGNNEHQALAAELGAILKTLIDWQGLGLTLVSANISNRSDDWTKNYRVPDLLVFAKHTQAIDRGSHWLGGPELAVEIVSEGDRTLEKLDFYASVRTRELLVIDRSPWHLSLFRYEPSSHRMVLAQDQEDLTSGDLIVSKEFPVQFLLNPSRSEIAILDGCGNFVRSMPVNVSGRG